MEDSFRKAKRIEILPTYLFDEIVRRKNEAISKGMDIIDLGVGDPDFSSPPHVVEALKSAVDEGKNHHYSSYRGMAELREAYGRWYLNRFGVTLDPESEILPLIGSKEGIGHIHLAFVEAGDAVLMPDPGYPTYQSGTILAGGEPIFMPLHKENGFVPDLKSLEKRELSRARLMHLNFPSNPTGAVAPLEFFREAVAFGHRHNIIICHDAAYTEIYYDGHPPPSFLQAEGAKEIGVEFHSLSKTYSMTGWRLGVAVGNREVVSALGSVKSNYDTGLFPAIQLAGIAALTGDQGWVEAMRQCYQKRRDIFVEGLNEIGFAVEKPRGSFYVWTPIPGAKPSREFCSMLLDEAGVVVTPGAGFGRFGEGYFRAALTVGESQLQEAVERFRKTIL